MKKYAEIFLDYLLTHGCTTTGYFGEKPVKLEDNKIHLYSQVATFTIWFNGEAASDSFINVSGEMEESNGEKEDFGNNFENWNDFCDWYSSQSFTWTEDLGYDILKLKDKSE